MKKMLLSLAVCAFATLMIFTAFLPSAQAAQNCSTCGSSNLGSVVSLPQNSDLSSYQTLFSNLKCGSNTQDCSANLCKVWAKDCNSNFFSENGIDINSLLSMLCQNYQPLTPTEEAADAGSSCPDGTCGQAQDDASSPDGTCGQTQDDTSCPDGTCEQAQDDASCSDGTCEQAQDDASCSDGTCEQAQDDASCSDGTCPTNSNTNSYTNGYYKIIYGSCQNIDDLYELYFNNYFTSIDDPSPAGNGGQATDDNNTPDNNYEEPNDDNNTTPVDNSDNSGNNDSQSGLTALEQQMVNLVNAERKAVGLDALEVNLELTQMARDKSQDMINYDYFSHTSPTYGSPFDMMATYGITYRAAGENIAMNSSVTAAHTALMNSEGHRANILSSSYSEIGIGIVQDSNGYYYISQEFIG